MPAERAEVEHIDCAANGYEGYSIKNGGQMKLSAETG